MEPALAIAAETPGMATSQALATVNASERGGVPEIPAANERAADVLRWIQLGHLVDHLDQVADWGRILSLGEQQRLAFGRLLLAAPQAAFLDEATSAMDEGLEDAMYRLVRERLPQTILVSVGHRSTLFRHHDRQLILKGDGSGAWMLEAAAVKPARV
jgi:putative ATP-binding cassette transporter